VPVTEPVPAPPQTVAPVAPSVPDPGTSIGTAGTPRGGFFPEAQPTWSLLNLLLALMAAAISVLLFANWSRRRRELGSEYALGEASEPEEAYGAGAGTGRPLALAILSAVLLAFSLLFLAGLQNFSGSMVFKDDVTIWHAVVMAADAVVAIIALRASEEYYDEA
jgi:hypothetical protein